MVLPRLALALDQSPVDGKWKLSHLILLCGIEELSTDGSAGIQLQKARFVEGRVSLL